MELIKSALSIAVFFAVSGCSTTVLKDTSGTKIVDVLHAHYSEQILQAINRVADSKDQNNVNVITPYNRNTTPINQSYNGQVAQTKKIVMPDTYPQKAWRDDESKTTTFVKAGESLKSDGVFTPTAKAQIEAQHQELSSKNSNLITQNKVLRDDIKTTQNTVKIAKTQAEKDVELTRLKALQEKQKIEANTTKDVKQVEAAASSKIKSVESTVPAPLNGKNERNPVVIK